MVAVGVGVQIDELAGKGARFDAVQERLDDVNGKYIELRAQADVQVTTRHA